MTTPPPNPNPAPSSLPGVPGPPTRHQLALMIWLAVFPTLTVLNLALGDWLGTLTPVVRTFVLATIAVPIVIYAEVAVALCKDCALNCRFGQIRPQSVVRKLACRYRLLPGNDVMIWL